MPLLAVTEVGSILTMRQGAFAVLRGTALLRTVPVHEIDEVQLHGAVELTAAARAFVLDRGIDTVFLSSDGRYRGRLVGDESSHGERRAAQYRWLAAPESTLTLARTLVSGKLRNQRTLLQRFDRGGDDLALGASVAALRHLTVRLDKAPTLDVVRGLEGQAAALYFRGFAAGLKNPAFTFRSRTRRPPRDPVNACLSYGYAVLLARCDSAVRAVGLDPGLGALHDAGRGKPSLALDLMEELRPVVVDRVVLRLINRRQLSQGDFRNPSLDEADASAPETGAPEAPTADASPPVYLADNGRRILLGELALTWRSRLVDPARGSQHTIEDILVSQARQLAALFEGRAERYQPFLLT